MSGKMTTKIVFVVIFLCFIPRILEINSLPILSEFKDDIDKCATGADNCECSSTDGFVICTCSSGYTGNGTTCTDIDECSTDADNNCDTNATCSNMYGSFTCTCNSGYSGDGTICTVYNSSCTRPEDCSHLAHSTCREENELKNDNVTSTQSYRNQCLCEENYYYNATSHLCHKYCGDPGEPTNGTSDKSNGSKHRWKYLAIATYNCDVGFDLVGNRTIVCNADGNWSPGRPSCYIKDCGDLPNVSSSNGLQSLTNNSKDTFYLSTATAHCLKGYRIKGNHSNDIVSNKINCQSSGNWSQLPQCEKKNCGKPKSTPNGNTTSGPEKTLFNDNVTYICNPGYYTTDKTYGTCTSSGNWSIPPPICSDINECALYTADCHRRANCHNTKGSYICDCQNGFTDISVGGRPGLNCEDIDECSKRSINFCNKNGSQCINYPGGFLCSCFDGWTGGNCTTDIDECNVNNTCGPHATGNNTLGSYNCTCNKGNPQENTHVHCYDIDECFNNSTNFCNDVGSQCINYPGSFLCSCFHGWTGRNCTTDIDECNKTTACGPHATCKNTIGSYNCTCNEGYPQGDPHIHCYEKVIIDFETKVEAFRGDDQQINSKPIQYRFPYFGVMYNSYRPNMNGFLTLGYQPVYEDYGPETSGGWKDYSRGLTVIAPFWTNLDSTNLTGGLYVHFFENYNNYGQNDSQHRDLTYLGEIFKYYYNLSDFTPRVALVATWLNVTQSSYIQPTRLVKTQNASMQVILISDGIYSYVMFNYDHELWSLKMEKNIPSSAGFSLSDKTGCIIATSKNISQLNTGTNVSPALSGRWIYDVSSNDSNINSVLRNESDCLEFSKNGTIRDWITDQRAKSYPCPCSEQQIQLDYSYHTVDPMYVPSPSTRCYEEWLFNNDGVKQTCCYSYGALKKENTGGGFATFENDKFDTVQYFYKCCGENTDRHLCHLFYEMNPPDDCSRFQPADEPIDS